MLAIARFSGTWSATRDASGAEPPLTWTEQLHSAHTQPWAWIADDLWLRNICTIAICSILLPCSVTT